MRELAPWAASQGAGLTRERRTASSDAKPNANVSIVGDSGFVRAYLIRIT